jgi:hypothetical protein
VLIAKVPGNVHIERGQRVSFVARPQVCHLFTADGFSVKPLAAVAHTV